MNQHDSERMAGLLEQAGYESHRRRPRRRRHRHQHLQRAREGRREALHAPRRDPHHGRRDRRRARSSPSPAASRSRKASSSSQRSNGRHRRPHRHAEPEAAADAGRARPVAAPRAAARRGLRRARPQSATTTSRFRSASPGAHDPHQGLRDDHRRLQRVLRLLRRPVHARQGADAAGARHRRRRPARGGHRREGSPAARADRQPLPGARTIRPATSPSCWRGSTTSTGIERIRFASPHPRHVTPRMIEAMRDLPKVCRHLHLPVQCGSTRVLQAMRRRHTREEYLELVGAAARGHAGHRAIDRYDRRLPGRDATRISRRRCRSPRPSGTTACSRSSTRRGRTRWRSSACRTTCAKEEKTRRIVALQALQRTIQGELFAAVVGRVEPVLVDATSRRREWELSGRTSGNTVVNLSGRSVVDRPDRRRSGSPGRTRTASAGEAVT